MLFNSYDFLIFFPVVLGIYFVIPRRVQYIWLLISSYYFYMSWNPKYAILMLISTLITYLSGILIQKYKQKVKMKKLFVFSSFAINLGILFLFKYFNFVFDNMNIILNKFNIGIATPGFDLILPVGISFYTFQALSYTIDIYKGNIKAEYNFFRYALFVSFFPQLVAGPIEKSRDLLPQLQETHEFEFERVKSGLLLMVWGFIQKLIIADRLAIIVNNIYNNYTEYSGFYLIIATICFSLQIYCDFSSYSDIAMGSAEVMGFKLSRNFHRPYFSKSISEFWRRWHITLGAWFREYLYIPLGGNRKGTIKKYRNIMMVFLASGLWHGASWGFVIWGGLHGLYQVVGDILKPIRIKIINILNINKRSFGYKASQITWVFILTSFAWIFFRAPSAKIAIEIIRKIFSIDLIGLFSNKIFDLGFTTYQLFYLFISLLCLVLVSLYRRNHSIRDFIKNQHGIFRYSIYSVVIVVLIFYWVSGQAAGDSSFIYFQF
ncbi:MBOAT family O-acyltransferase [Clostridium sp. UBA7791]|uniref:MBOAT family O-acyltransferase n=1 Tax=Clostridium sp. UBA7791 TaxID=1946379 RepID=UPI0032180FCC